MPSSISEKNASLIITHKFETKQRIYVFTILTIINTLVNMDHGTIPASSNEIKRDLKINESHLGVFGSLVYLGNLIGALCLTRLIDMINRKLLIIVTTIISAILIFSFTKINYIYYLLLNRVLVGIVQIFITIYFPVWIDQYGPKKWKTIMMSIFNVTSPLGVMFGYILTMTVKQHLDVSKLFYILVESILFNSSNITSCYSFTLFFT